MAYPIELREQYRKEYMREYFRRRRKMLNSLNLCSECGCADSSTKNGSKQCDKCKERAKQNLLNKKKNLKEINNGRNQFKN